MFTNTSNIKSAVTEEYGNDTSSQEVSKQIATFDEVCTSIDQVEAKMKRIMASVRMQISRQRGGCRR